MGGRFPSGSALSSRVSFHLCLKSLKASSIPRPRSLPISGGFFDVANAQKRLGEIDSLMADEKFWNNREQAQKLIDESNTIRKRIDPLLKAEKNLEDFNVMVELGEAEPPASQAQIEKDLERDLAKFFKELDS